MFAVDNKSAITDPTSDIHLVTSGRFLHSQKQYGSNDSSEFITRLGNGLSYTNNAGTDVDGGSSFLSKFSYNNGWGDSAGSDSNDYLWMFKRAPGFMDVVAYTGTGSLTGVNQV